MSGNTQQIGEGPLVKVLKKISKQIASLTSVSYSVAAAASASATLNTRIDLVADVGVLDWALGDTFLSPPITQALVLSDLNLPTGTRTGTIDLWVSGDYAITVTAYWELVGGVYDVTKECQYVIECIIGDGGNEKVKYTINVPG